LVLLDSLPIFNKEILLFKLIFELYEPVIFRLFGHDFLVKALDVKANLIKQKIYDRQVVEGKLLGPLDAL
jgi:hypothetical protein